MSLLQYVDEEIDECRGIEYLRRACPTGAAFMDVLVMTSRGRMLAREKYPRGELDMSCSFELVRTASDNRRLIRVRLVTAPPRIKQYQRENFTTFLVILNQEGSITEVCNDTIH